MEWLGQGSNAFHELIVVDDGSRDATASVVGKLQAARPSVRLLSNPGNRGKGYAIRHGMLEARGEWILYTDADLSTPIAEISKLYAAAVEQKADVAIGSRALNRALVSVHQPVFREYSGRFFNLVMRTVTGLQFRDTQCGFKLFRAEAARQIFLLQKQEGCSFDQKALVIAKKFGRRHTSA